MAEAYLGRTLIIQTKDGQFEGILINIDSESKKITLNKVKVNSNGKRLRTPCHFYSNEISELKLKPEKTKEKSSEKQINNGGNVSVKKQSGNPEASPEHKNEEEKERSHGERTSHIGSHTANAWQGLTTKGYILLDTIDNQFLKVMQHLKGQHFIGLAMGGLNIGRRGDVKIVQVNADDITYIFDVQLLGADLFNYRKGNLGEILESHAIVKVMHDCRWVSDFLHHRYGIKLNCLYDTQVADILIHRHEKASEIPRYTRGLAECLLEYLEISVSEVYSKMVHSKTQMDDEYQWEERPLNHDLLDSAVQDVRYLLDLRVATLRRLMGELMCATHIYLSCVRDASEGRGSRGKDPSLVPYGLTDLFRRGYRNGMSDVYERYQFGAEGEGDSKKSDDGAIPWDLWQPGQKLNPALHKKNPQAQFADAPGAAPNLVAAANDTTLNHSALNNVVNHSAPNLPEDTEHPPTDAVVTCNGMAAGAEGDSSDSVEEDVFGDDDGYNWFTNRKPTVEGEVPDVTQNDVKTLHNDVRTLHDERAGQTSTVKAWRDSTNVAAQRKSQSVQRKEQTYQTDKNMYIPPVVMSVTDLYNLPVNGVASSSTDDESSPVDESEGPADDQPNATVEKEQQTTSEPIKWPAASKGSVDFVVKPAGMEKKSLFEDLPSPQRSLNTTDSKPSLGRGQHIHLNSEGARTLTAEVQRNESPLSIPELEDEHEEDDELEEVGHEEVGPEEQFDSTGTYHRYHAQNTNDEVDNEVVNSLDIALSQNATAENNLRHSEEKHGASYHTSEQPVSNVQRPDQQRYIPPRMRNNLPPRFLKQLDKNRDNSSRGQPSRGQPNLTAANHRGISNDIVESGSESISSSSSSSSSDVATRKSNQGSIHSEMQNASSKPCTFGEVMAQLSDQGGADSDSSFGENIPNRRRTDIFGNGTHGSSDNRPTSSENELSDYDQIMASRLSTASPVGRGRARALTVSVDQLPGRRAQQEKVRYSTNLLGNEVRMDFPSEYQMQNAPKAIPIRANSHLLSVKTIGRGRPF